MEVKSRIDARQQRTESKITCDQADVYCGVLDNMGVGMSKSAQSYLSNNAGTVETYTGFTFDEAVPMSTTPSNSLPVQFAQWWRPNFIETIFTKRVADEYLGLTNAGTWSDIEVVIPEVETLGQTAIYGDYADSANANWNANFSKRAVVRFMSSLQVGALEAEQTAKMRIDSKSRKMIAVTNALELQRNAVAFNGFLVGTEANYGILNDPRLPEYGTLSVGASGSTKLMDKTYTEIVNDFRAMINELVVKMGGNFDPTNEAFTVALPLSASQAMSAVTPYGNAGSNSVQMWFDTTYKNGRIIYIPQFDSAMGGENVMYITIDKVNGESNLDQFVQQKMFLVGFEKRDTYYKETYSNATAGAFVGYGIGVIRVIGA